MVRTLEAETEPNDPSVGSPLAHEIVWPTWEQLREEMMTQLDTITIDDLCQRARAKGLDPAKTPAQRPPSALSVLCVRRF